MQYLQTPPKAPPKELTFSQKNAKNEILQAPEPPFEKSYIINVFVAELTISTNTMSLLLSICYSICICVCCCICVCTYLYLYFHLCSKLCLYLCLYLCVALAFIFLFVFVWWCLDHFLLLVLRICCCCQVVLNCISKSRVA